MVQSSEVMGWRCRLPHGGNTADTPENKWPGDEFSCAGPLYEAIERVRCYFQFANSASVI
jgi:hypothetical protein